MVIGSLKQSIGTMPHPYFARLTFATLAHEDSCVVHKKLKFVNYTQLFSTYSFVLKSVQVKGVHYLFKKTKQNINKKNLQGHPTTLPHFPASHLVEPPDRASEISESPCSLLIFESLR